MPKKIAVLGGGPASMTAVYYILDAYDWDPEAVEITVYQMGWRLGGKCASGRNMEHHARVEEHGIHFWFGCYHNAFRWILDCYPRMKEATGYHPYTWDEAVIPAPSYVGYTKITDGWDEWKIQPHAWDIPPDQAMNHSGQIEDFTAYIGDYVLKALDMLDASIHKHEKNVKEAEINIHGFHVNVDKLRKRIARIRDQFETLRADHQFDKDHPLVKALVRDLTGLLRFNGNMFYDYLEHHESVRRIFVLVDLMFTVLNGLIRDDVLHSGFEVINDIDFLHWLRKHGASDVTLENTLIRSYYDGAFAFRNGDKNRPDSEAGTTLMGIVFSLFTNDESMFFKFRGSMGEVVFTPFYLLLKSFGVQFKFFHRVDELKLNEGKTQIEEVLIGKQVNCTSEDGSYDPLVDINGIKCWPSEPKYDLLAEGDRLQQMQSEGKNVNLESFWTEWEDVEQINLKKGRDFDELIFGIPIASVPYLCTELIEANSRWQDMVSHMETVATQAVQIWIDRSARELGWNYPKSTIYTTFEEPLDTWCANPELVPLEQWPEELGTEDVFFFVGSLPDPAQVPPPSFAEYPSIMREKVHEQFIKYLVDEVTVPFPSVRPSDDSDEWFHWSLLIDPEHRRGMDRLNGQYFRANVDPSERYVLSVVNSSKYRLKTDQTGFENLYITGDWIETPLNSGCFEAAVMAGLETARAVTGRDISILGEFAFQKHPSSDE